MSDPIIPSQPVSRRGFVSRVGAFGLGAAGATALLSACGSDNAVPGSRQAAGIPGQLVANPTLFGLEFNNILSDETDHVNFLVQAITATFGAAAVRPEPKWDFTQAVWNPADVATFVALADALENTGTGAYLYATNNTALQGAPTVLQAAAAIALVEGRHAGFLNALTGRPLLTDPNPNIQPQSSTSPTTNYLGVTSHAMEVAQPPSVVYARAAPFTVNMNLNGGPALPQDADIPGAPLVAVLNYALFLEYLERDWYARNTPRFFGAAR